MVHGVNGENMKIAAAYAEEVLKAETDNARTLSQLMEGETVQVHHQSQGLATINIVCFATGHG